MSDMPVINNLSRRSFFRLAAGAALAPIAAKVAALSPSFYLWGDGKHDDTDAIHALLNGDIVEFSGHIDGAGCGWHGNVLIMPRGEYLLSSPLTFDGKNTPSNSDMTFDLMHSVFRHAHDGPRMHLEDLTNCLIANSIHVPANSFRTGQYGVLYLAR